MYDFSELSREDRGFTLREFRLEELCTWSGLRGFSLRTRGIDFNQVEEIRRVFLFRISCKAEVFV